MKHGVSVSTSSHSLPSNPDYDEFPIQNKEGKAQHL